MSQQVTCDACGAVLLEAVTERGVLPVSGGQEIPFRRTTDYVMCPGCFATYSIRDLMKAARPATPDAEADIIELLERMAQRRG